MFQQRLCSLPLLLTRFLNLQVLLQAARVRLFKERKMHSVIREIVFYLLFVWIVLLIAYGHRDPYAHFMTQNMENTFVGNQESPGAREDGKQEVTTDKPTGNDTIKLADVSTFCEGIVVLCLTFLSFDQHKPTVSNRISNK